MVTVVEGNLKAPFSIAPTLSADVGESATPFPGLLLFARDIYLISKVASNTILV